MSITIQVPTPMRRFVANHEQLLVQGATVGEALSQATQEYPGLQRQLFAGDGRVRGFIRVFVDARDISQLQREQTPLSGGEVITLVPAIAGG